MEFPAEVSQANVQILRIIFRYNYTIQTTIALLSINVVLISRMIYRNYTHNIPGLKFPKQGYNNDLLPSYYEENKAPELASVEVTRQAIEANSMDRP